MEIDTYINENVVFNPNYKLRGDDNNIIITNNDSAIANSLDLSNKNDFTTGFAWPIHPFIATMINYFDGKRTLKQVIEIISTETALSFDEVKSSISKIFLNQDIIFYPVEDKNISLPLPINVLILNNNNFVRDNALLNIDIDYILENMDFKKKRLSIPNECTLMINNTCYTKCIYCYVDKRHVHDMLPFERWKEIISEARKLNMRDCQINGGDLFSYKYWYELLCCLYEHNYGPYLSTKYPLTETMVAKLASLKIKKLQFSIDSVNKSSLSSILKVDSQDSLQEGNPCKTCVDFERCRHGKGACFRLAYTAYGLDCWNYPPPQCPYAPKVTADIYIK